MPKVLRRLIWCVCIYLLFCSVAAIFLVKVTLHPQRRPLRTAADAGMVHIAAQSDAQLEDVELSVADGVPLRAWYIVPAHGNQEAVILLHGVGDNRLGMTGYAQLLLTHGYAVLMPDARAHGTSGGDLVTYGVLEREDIREWFEWFEKKSHANCIFGFGESMGAAQLLQALEAERHFCAVAAESSFATFREIAYDRMGQYFHAGPWVGRTVLRPVVEIALTIVQLKYHLDLTKASPADAVAYTGVPVLLIHGEVDSNIPVRHSRLLKARDPQAELWEVPKADHCGAITVAPAEFERRMVSWFETHDHPAASQMQATAAK
jgi:uncharacterized protein